MQNVYAVRLYRRKEPQDVVQEENPFMDQELLGTLSLSHFHCFLAVAESGTMSLAAESLGISQPTVSQRIAYLERVLGIKLFERAKGRCHLSAAGAYFLEKCAASMEALSELTVELKARFAEQRNCRLRVGFSNGSESSTISFFKSLLHQTVPGCQIETVIHDRLSLNDKILSGELDLALMIDTEHLLPNKKLNYRTMRLVTVSCLVHRNSPLAQKAAISWEDLNGYTLYWPTALKNTAHTKDLLALIKRKGIELNVQYCDVDFFTIRRYLVLKNSVTFTYTERMDDSNFKLLPMDELAYPFSIIWRTEHTELLRPFVEKAMADYKKVHN